MSDVAAARRRAKELLRWAGGDVVAVADVERVARDVLDLADLVVDLEAALAGQRVNPRFWLDLMRRRLRTGG